MEKRIAEEDICHSLVRESKRLGFTDEQIGALCQDSANHIRELRMEWDLRPVYKTVDTCAAEFEAVTPYFYSTYEEENEQNVDVQHEISGCRGSKRLPRESRCLRLF
mgnify:CR=1 FL=1